MPSVAAKLPLEPALPTPDQPEATAGRRNAPFARAGENLEIDAWRVALPARVVAVV